MCSGVLDICVLCLLELLSLRIRSATRYWKDIRKLPVWPYKELIIKSESRVCDIPVYTNIGNMLTHIFQQPFETQYFLEARWKHSSCKRIQHIQVAQAHTQTNIHHVGSTVQTTATIVWKHICIHVSCKRRITCRAPTLSGTMSALGKSLACLLLKSTFENGGWTWLFERMWKELRIWLLKTM